MDSRPIEIRPPFCSRPSRRHLLGSLVTLPLAATAARAALPEAPRWVTPKDRGWPDQREWDALASRVGGRLVPVTMPDISGPAGTRHLANPFYIRDEPALTQSSGWVDAWQSAPSAYVLKARDARDVAHAIDFARERRVRLVTKGGGHSYLGGSNAADSLLVWTRAMDEIVMHDGFRPAGGDKAPVPAVSVGAGCIWGHVYEAVTTRGGRYVQGGGCATVGVAGLVLGGGFGSYSKRFGLAAASLIEAEIVTADGRIRTVNAHQDPDLFWALKGGGGGTFGVITRLTLRTHALPATYGNAALTLRARSDAAFRPLLERFLLTYSAHLFNPRWGEQVSATPDNRLVVNMTFLDLNEDEARAAWEGLIAFARSDPAAYEIVSALTVHSVEGQHLWDAGFLERHIPGLIARDDRPGAPSDNWWWAGDGEQAGAMWHGYSSLWLPASLLEDAQRPRFVDAWFEASRIWPVTFHFNKGLAGADPATIEASRDSSMNPEVLDAFALAIIAGNGDSSYPGVEKPADFIEAQADAARIAEAMQKLRAAAPGAGAYLSECDYFLDDWQHACWGQHWPRLERIKRRVDPDGMFIVHHGIGSDAVAA